MFFIIDTKPLARVGDKCSFNPISSIKLMSASRISIAFWFENVRINIAIIPFVKIASLSAVKIILSSFCSPLSQTFD